MKRNFIVMKREFSRIVKHPLEQVKAGFAKSGIYPFNPDAVAKHKLITSSLHESFSSTSDSESSSLYSSSVSESPNPPSQPFSLSQSPSQQSQQTTQTIVPPALPPPHTVDGTSGALQHRLLFHQLCLLHTLFMVLLEPYNTDYCSTSSASSTHCLWYFWSLTRWRCCNCCFTEWHCDDKHNTNSCSFPFECCLCTSCTFKQAFSNNECGIGTWGLVRHSQHTSEWTKRITGARNLTSEEYVEMLREDKNKKIEAEELKEKRNHEREKRKKEIERRWRKHSWRSEKGRREGTTEEW